MAHRRVRLGGLLLSGGREVGSAPLAFFREGLRALSKTSFEVIATGEKARDLPSRLDQIPLVALFSGNVDEIQAGTIAADAKKLCTVTNTLVGAPNLEVRFID